MTKNQDSLTSDYSKSHGIQIANNNICSSSFTIEGNTETIDSVAEKYHSTISKPNNKMYLIRHGLTLSITSHLLKTLSLAIILSLFFREKFCCVLRN